MYFKDISKCTTIKLKKICQEEKITGYSKLNKKELINRIVLVRLERMVNDGIKTLSNT